MLDGYIDELAIYQCSCAAGELSDVQTTLLTAIVNKFSPAGSFVTMATLLNRVAPPPHVLIKLGRYDLNWLDTV